MKGMMKGDMKKAGPMPKGIPPKTMPKGMPPKGMPMKATGKKGK
jgi:hypothetical protein